MSNPDLTRPDVRSIHAAAKQAEFAEAARSVAGADGCLSAGDDLPVPGRDRRVPYHRPRRARNAALAGIPHRIRYPIRQLGTTGGSLVAGNRRQGTGAGR
jgi:hypothetical protein